MRSSVLIILALGLGACAQMPIAPRNPIFVNGSLQGHLKDGTYLDKYDWFSVGTPLVPSDPLYTQLSITEDYVEHVSYVGFAPLSSPGEYYRVYMEDFYASNHPVPSMDEVADSAIKVFGAGIVKQRVEPMRLVEERPWAVGATTGLLRLYTERTPTELLMQNLGMAEDYTAYILMYVTAQKGKVAVLWAEWPMDCPVCTPLVAGPATASADPIDKALAADGRSKPFMDSFQYHAD